MRRNRGPGLLVNLRHVAIRSMDDHLLTMLRVLWTRGYWRSAADAARQLNVHKETVLKIVTPTVVPNSERPRRCKTVEVGKVTQKMVKDEWLKFRGKCTVSFFFASCTS